MKIKIKKYSTIFLFLFLLLRLPSMAEMITEKQEIQLGMQGSKKLEEKYGVVDDAAQMARVNRIGQSIAQISDRRNLKYSFKVLNTNNVNALAFPGGFVYVTKGLLPNVTDAELAYVIGHEVAHVAKKHSVKQLEKKMWTDLGLVTITALLNKGEVNEGSLNTIGAVSTIINSKYSRDDETEADITACHYMVNGCGYNPRAGITFMQKLKKIGGGELPGFVNSLVGSHPLTDERISRIDQECKNMGY